MNSRVPMPLWAPQVHSTRWVAGLRKAHRGHLWNWLSIAWARQTCPPLRSPAALKRQAERLFAEVETNEKTTNSILTPNIQNRNLNLQYRRWL